MIETLIKEIFVIQFVNQLGDKTQKLSMQILCYTQAFKLLYGLNLLITNSNVHAAYHDAVQFIQQPPLKLLCTK